MNVRMQCLLVTIALFIVDFATPFVPLFGILAFYLLWQRPPWFRTVVNAIYEQ